MVKPTYWLDYTVCVANNSVFEPSVVKEKHLVIQIFLLGYTILSNNNLKAVDVFGPLLTTTGNIPNQPQMTNKN